MGFSLVLHQGRRSKKGFICLLSCLLAAGLASNSLLTTELSDVPSTSEQDGLSSLAEFQLNSPGLSKPFGSQGGEFPPAGLATKTERAKTQASMEFLGDRPLVFIENRGQVEERANFYLRNGAQTLWLTSEGIIFDLLREKSYEGTRVKPTESLANLPLVHSHSDLSRDRLVFEQMFIGSSPPISIEAKDIQPGIYNFFRGNDTAEWASGIQGFGEVVYQDIWEAIDLKLYSNGQNLEQEYIVRPGGDLNQLQVAYRSIDGLRLADDGSLYIQTDFG